MKRELKRDWLTSRFWIFSHLNGPIAARFLRFNRDGTIGNYDHPNEKYWKLEGETLLFLSFQKEVTAVLNEISDDDGDVIISGPHLLIPGIVLSLREQKETWPKREGTRHHFAAQIANLGWEIGDHTYGAPTVFEMHLSKLRIGKYTSIATGVKIILGDHRTDTVTTYPFGELRSWWVSVPYAVEDHTTKGDIDIGNDVWIGTDSIVLSGVAIGDGAVIGAGSVVTKDVPPYSVVVGNPGRVVKTRFPAHIVAALIKLSWWHWPEELVDSFLPKMMNTDIEGFLRAAAVQAEFLNPGDKPAPKK
jgi:acetyltransferase-like isoleucine patch superfamily enzyme